MQKLTFCSSLAWKFLFLCSFLKTYPWTLKAKRSFFNKLRAQRIGLKQKVRGSQGEKLAKRGIEKLQSRKKYNKNIETLLAKQIFFPPYLRQAAEIYVATSHSVVRQETIEKNLSKELLLYELLHKRSTDVWKTVTNSARRPHCINKRL